MTVEEAIEKLRKRYSIVKTEDIQLGIEALEQVIQCRKVPFLQTCMNKLPSETEE